MNYYNNPYRRLVDLGMRGWQRRFEEGGPVKTVQLDENGNPIEAQLSDYNIAVMDPKTQRQYAQMIGQTAGSQASGVSNALARYTTDEDGNIIADNAYVLDDVVATAPDLRAAKMARERPDYQGLNEFANAAPGGLAGLAGLYGGKAWNEGWKAVMGNDWNTSVINGLNWIGDKTGLYQVNPNNRYVQLGASVTNPGTWAGIGGVARVLGRPAIIGAPQESLLSTKGLSYADAMAKAGSEGRALLRSMADADPSMMAKKGTVVRPVSGDAYGSFEDPRYSLEYDPAWVERTGDPSTAYEAPNIAGRPFYETEIGTGSGDRFYINPSSLRRGNSSQFSIEETQKGIQDAMNDWDAFMSDFGRRKYDFVKDEDKPRFAYDFIKDKDKPRFEYDFVKDKDRPKYEYDFIKEKPMTKEEAIEKFGRGRVRYDLLADEYVRKPFYFDFEKDAKHGYGINHDFVFRKDEPTKWNFRKEPTTMKDKAERWLIDHGLSWLVRPHE